MRLFKICCWLLPIVLLWCTHDLFAQKNQNFKLYLRNGTVEPPANLSEGSPVIGLRKNSATDAKRLVIIQFYDIPAEQSIERLRNAGIDLLEYVPENAYTATLSGEPDTALLRSANARSILELAPSRKIDPLLNGPDFPEHAVKVPGKVDVRISYPRSIDLKNIREDLQKSNFEILSEALSSYQILEVRSEQNRLQELAALPWLQYIAAIPAPGEPLNDKSAADSRANVLGSMLPGGRKLDGEGVTIGIGDAGNPFEHADLTGRVVSFTRQSSYWHGLHIAGTAAGAGIVNEKYKGYAPKANIVMQYPDDIWGNAATYVRDFGMVATNNSWGTGGNSCGSFGEYNENSYILDRQASELPGLLHVYAAGNSGNVSPCNGFTGGFGTVQGYHASAKNVLTVGRLGVDGTISVASSRGPVLDGRIKPELIAPGGNIFSTLPNDTYQQGSGTSMAAPAAVGGTALLCQRYRQLNSHQNPKSALIKALLMNGATERGLPGPDFIYGFGVMNLLRSVTMLEKGHYISGSMANNGGSEFQVNVPAGTAALKVMLYWHDPASSALITDKTLVNDLDLKLIRPNGTQQIPLVPNPAAPTAEAVATVDTVNNAEQIVIENPIEGSYTLKVTGSKVPAGPQEYFIVYDIIEKSMVLTNPIGSEHLTKGDAVIVSWDSYGNPSSKYALSYSLNNGASWTSINAAVPAGTTRLSWTAPDAFTTTAKIRLVQSETGVVKESGVFSIMAVPVMALSPVQCERYAAVQWTPVTGATDYEVMRLQGTEMKPVAVTTGLNYTFTGLSRDSTYYFSVRPRLNGIPGRRAVAIKRNPSDGTCAGAISDNDLGIDSIISPRRSGRMLTSGSLSATHPVTIGIRNFDDQPVAGSFEVGYSIGESGAAVHWETVGQGIPAQGYLEYTFNQPADLHAAGTYVFNFFVKSNGDVVPVNNQKTIVVKQLPNAALTLPYTEDFESLSSQTLLSETTGLSDGDRYDFASESNMGRLRTHAEPVLAYSGSKALTLDVVNGQGEQYSTSVTGTYNLEGRRINSDQVVLTFRFLDFTYGIVSVYVRGKDTDPWIPAFNDGNQYYLPRDKGTMLGTVDVSGLLRRNSQEFSTSFQIMWQKWSSYPAQRDGFSIDDVKLFTTRSDLEVSRIIRPSLPPCYVYPEVGILVKNNGDNDSYNVPVVVHLEGTKIFEDYIPVVRAGKDTLYTFETGSNLSVPGDHVVRARVGYDFDSNPANDSLEAVLDTPPTVTQLPYLEDFENGPGGWQAVGLNPAWQFGHPASGKVKGAASGEKAWKTNLTGPYQNDGYSYLYSPCFSVTGPFIKLSFSASVDLDPCDAGVCDMVYVEVNAGWGWTRVETLNDGAITNWYNVTDSGTDRAWNVQDHTRWHVSTNLLSMWGVYNFRLRFVLKGNSSAAREGFAIDDVHIYQADGGILADGGSGQTSEDNPVKNSWTTLRLGIMSEGVAAINPYDQSIGRVGAVLSANQNRTPIERSQYYLPRSFVISTAETTYPEPVGVRLFFTDKEVEGIIGAPDVAGVTKPLSAYDLSVTKYSGIYEDGFLSNNSGNGWSYFPKSAVKIVPYQNGYYAEFKTKTFSEFWLAGGYLGLGDPMPVTLAAFSAKKQAANSENKQSVLLEWHTTQEEAFSHFEIEVARDKESLLKKQFAQIGEVPGRGGNDPTRAYSFMDYCSFAAGTSYYRLKIVDRDGSFEYSAIRPVNFDAEREWKVFPNPAEKRIFVEFEEKAGRLLKFSISDVEGRVVFTDHVVANGGLQKKEIDLSARAVAPGIYLLKVVAEDREKVFKIIRK